MLVLLDSSYSTFVYFWGFFFLLVILWSASGKGFFKQYLVIVVEDTRIYAYSTFPVVKLPTSLRTKRTCFSYSALAAQDVNVSWFI